MKWPRCRPEQVRGKIVLFDAPYQGYGRTVIYRVAGASRAAALGAVAVLVRSITPFSLRTPHTGTLIYSARRRPRFPRPPSPSKMPKPSIA